MRGDIDDTVRLPRGRPRPAARTLLAGSLTATLLLVFALAGVLWLRPNATPVRLADEATIDADSPAQLAVFRVVQRPSIVVLDFPSLAEQGRTLDRVAALVEKKGLPHDRVLDDAALAAAIKAGGDTPDTWYYGHDYRAADIDRFFSLAAAEGVTLNPDEQRLHHLLDRLRGQRDGFGAVITLPRALPGSGVTDAVRHVILHHELSHGYYFTDPDYVRAVTVTWRDVLTADERAKVRAYLAAEEYDPALTDLMQNEMQAYLVYTPPGPFFDPGRLGIPPDRLTAIRDSLIPAGPHWLSPAF